VLGSKLKVYASHISFTVFVLDPKVGEWNLSADELQAVSLRYLPLALGGMFFWAELRQVVKNALLQFEVEENARILATLPLNVFV